MLHNIQNYSREQKLMSSDCPCSDPPVGRLLPVLGQDVVGGLVGPGPPHHRSRVGGVSDGVLGDLGAARRGPREALVRPAHRGELALRLDRAAPGVKTQ